MLWLCLLLLIVGLAFGVPLTALVLALSRRWGAFDTPARAGQVKMEARRIPNTGGVAIFWAFAGPVLIGLAAVWLLGETLAGWMPALAPHLEGIRGESPTALLLLVCLGVLHAMGLIDDRRPMGPWLKLGLILGVALLVSVGTGTRLLSAVDPYVGGAWLSILLTVLWLGVVTNALNFMDNMDGLAGGTVAVAGACFLAAALVNGQWFVSASLALLVGGVLGFLVFNRPPARIFMGDGGSLVIGFLLGFLTVRTTYYDPEAGGGWYAVFMPLVVLAVPLYDFVSVTLIRLSQGRSPFVGDLQHFSHRLVRRGLSKPAAVAVILAFTAVTGISGISLGSLEGWQAVLVAVQIGVLLMAIGMLEWSGRAGAEGGDALGPASDTSEGVSPSEE